MVEIKLVIGNPKTKTSVQKIVSSENSKFLIGKKIGENFKGETIDLTGYEFEITGGSDNSGFPMRKDLSGTLKKKILATDGVGFNIKRKGMRKRKHVAGNTIYEKTSQVNVKILKHGKAPLEEPKKPEDKNKKEEKKK